MELTKNKIAIIGLGYVGLPLAVEFGKKFKTIGFDINEKRLNDLRAGFDETLEVTDKELFSSKYLSFTNLTEEIATCNIFIITVPTPIDSNKKPDLNPLLNSSKMVGGVLKRDDIVIYESTVYPGATEEECVPVLESESGLKFNKDFYAGYSPERINPGDKKHKLENIIKVASGSNPETATVVDNLYASIIKAGTYKSTSIKVAEAAKVIENTQRDVNIALINELALIFEKLNIDTHEVLQTAGTKWNFLNFQPGLVGGHCIGVDPYYLTFKSQQVGYDPEIILAGRRLNDSMGFYVASRMVRAMKEKEINISKSKVLVMGITFKENCPDIRNTKVIDVIRSLEDFGANVDCYDSWANPEEVKKEYDIAIIDEPALNNYDGIIITIPHNNFIEMKPEKIREFGLTNHILYDLKSVFSKDESDLRL